MLNYREYVYAVYQESSFSKAAAKLYVSQPWLSATVKKVEQEIGSPIFDRRTSPITLTEAGTYYIEQIEKIMAIESEMKLHFAQVKAEARASLRIGSSMFFCTYVLPGMLEEFRVQHPEVTISFTEGNTAYLTDQLLAGQLDLMLETEHPQNKRIHTVPWASEEIILGVPASNPINERLKDYCFTFDEFLAANQNHFQKKAISLKEFEEETFLLINRHNDMYFRCMQMCQNAGFVPKNSMMMTQMMTAYYLVTEGKGISFLRSSIPRFVVPTDKIVFYHLDDELVKRNIYLSYLSRKTPFAQKNLIDFMRSKGSMAEQF